MPPKDDLLKYNPSEILSWANKMLDNKGVGSFSGAPGVPRFDENNTLRNLLGAGGISQQRDMGFAGNIFQDVSRALAEKIKNASIDTKDIEQSFAQTIKAAFDQIELAVDSDTLTKIFDDIVPTAQRLGTALKSMAELRDASPAGSVQAAAAQAAITGIANKDFTGLNIGNITRLEAELTDRIQRAQTAAEAENVGAYAAERSAGLKKEQIMLASAPDRFLQTGQYGRLSEVTKSREAGSEEELLLRRQIAQGIRSNIINSQAASSAQQNKGLFSLFGVSTSDIGPNADEARQGLMEGIKSARDQIRRADAKIKEARAKIESGEGDVEVNEGIIAQEQERKKELGRSLEEGVQELARPMRESMASAGQNLKSAISTIINGIALMGRALSEQIGMLAKATLNPMVEDLFSSLKYGLEIGIQAGQMIYNITKSTLDAGANAFGAGGFLPAMIGNRFGGGASPTGSGAPGGLASAARIGGAVLKGGIGATLGYMASNMAGEGIRAYGDLTGQRKDESGRFTEEGKKNEMLASRVQGFGQGASVGAGVGFAVGQIVPIIGPIVGAVAGGLIGGIIGGISGNMRGGANIRAAEKEAEKAEKERKYNLNVSAMQAGALPLGLDVSGLSTGNIAEKFTGSLGGLEGKLKELGMAGTGAAALSMLAGNTGVGKVGRNVMAAMAGVGGGAAIGAAMATLDFFMKSLTRGAEALQRFAEVSNNIGMSINSQMRRIGDAAGSMGEKGRLTEADISTYLFNFMTNRGMGRLGYSTEQVGAMFGKMSGGSLMGLTGIGESVESAMILSRELGVAADSLLQQYSTAEKMTGVGGGAELFNRVLLGAGPRTEAGGLNAISLEVTSALVDAARQLQMSGPQTASSGAQFTDFMSSLYTSVREGGSDFGTFITQNPEVLASMAQSVGGFFQSAVTGQNPLALSLGSISGMSMRQMSEFGSVQDAGSFETAIGSIMSLLPETAFEGGRVSQSAMENQLPVFLNALGLKGSVAGYAEIFNLVRAGKIEDAQKEFEKIKPKSEEAKILSNIDKNIGEGFPALLEQNNRGQQETLQLMESNIDGLIKLSTAATEAGKELLKIGNEFITPVIGKMAEPLMWIAEGLKQVNKILNPELEKALESPMSSEGYAKLAAQQGLTSADLTSTASAAISKEQFAAMSGKDILAAGGERGLNVLRNWGMDKNVLFNRGYTGVRSDLLSDEASFLNAGTKADLLENAGLFFAGQGWSFKDTSKIKDEDLQGLLAPIFGDDLVGDPKKRTELRNVLGTVIGTKEGKDVTYAEAIFSNVENDAKFSNKAGVSLGNLASQLQGIYGGSINLSELTIAEAVLDRFLELNRSIDGGEQAAAVAAGGSFMEDTNPFLKALAGKTILFAVPIDGSYTIDPAELGAEIDRWNQANKRAGKK